MEQHKRKKDKNGTNDQELIMSRDSTPTFDTMYRSLFDAIAEHQLLPGTKLREDTLVETFGVSRTRIRAVLQKLNHIGMVEMHQFRGAYVAQPSEQEAREVFEIRRIVESGIIPEVITRVKSSDIKRLQNILNREAQAIRKNDRTEAIRQSGEFHIQLCDILGNGSLTDLLHGLVSRTSLIIAVFPPSGISACDSEHHATLLARISERDLPGAIEALRVDLEATLQSLSFKSDAEGEADLGRIVSKFVARHSNM